MTELTTTPEQKTTTLNDMLAKPLLASLNLDWEKAIYLVFIILAIVSRFVLLGNRVMSHDESLHTQFSYQYFIGDGYSHTPLMHGPFLFHITALFYWLFGDSDFVARMPVALFGVILVVMPYFLRKPLGKVGALFTSFLFLISPYITYYSRYIRHDIYVIMWAMIVFIAIWYYLGDTKEKYLWWFAAGTSLMFATKEVAFIYVAIFGSFLVIRLLAKMWLAPWLKTGIKQLRMPMLVAIIALLLIGAGLVGQKLVARSAAPESVATATLEGFAADPNEETAVSTPDAAPNDTLFRWTQVIGIGVLSLGLFLAARALRPQIDDLPEFDLIMLFTTLILPMVTPLIVRILGWDPTDYAIPQCVVPGQESMSRLQVALARMFDSGCWANILQSDFLYTLIIFIVVLLISIAVGLWWHSRKWAISAAIFYAIFLFLYTSVFTNIVNGIPSGMFGSLGYWLEQQGVQRGSQPTFYYLVVMPIYEFLPVIFSLAAIWLWSKKERLHQILAYWVTTGLLAFFSYSLVKWLYARSYRLSGRIIGEETAVLGLSRDVFLGLIVALFILFVAVILWLVAVRKRLKQKDETSLLDRFYPEQLLGFMPYVTWWLLLTWAAYSYAGEKMPWLSTHFVIPMALMSGWYFGEKLKNLGRADLFCRRSLLFGGLTALLLIAFFGLFGLLWLGKIQLGSQEIAAMQSVGLFIGLLAIVGIVAYFWQRIYREVERPLRGTLIILTLFTLLSLLTIRASYMASFPNADYTTEFMVYAHGAPATKEIVMNQVETLSMRLHGDKSIKVAYDNDVSWPFTWYLRDYPNRLYFGENPSNSLNEAPIIVVGNQNWGKVEPFLGNNYEENIYTFLWWPMEEYRRLNWDAIFGDPLSPEQRGLGNVDVRRALWDIFFYRDYTQFGQTFGGTYTAREWPLRHELKVYTRRDVLANLWDQGVAPVNAEPFSDPYAEGELTLSPSLILNELAVPGSGEGQFTTPRNVAVGPDGSIFVADSGNHRIQVFAEDGRFLTGWGQFGAEPGQFNEPWGLAVDEEFVYVADTWNHRIQKFTHEGELVGAFGQNGSPFDETDSGLGLFYGPRDVALVDDDRLAVTDTGNHRIQLMDREGNFLSSVGSQGSQPGQFNEPVGLDTGPGGNVFMADTWNGRVQELTPELFPVNEWLINGWYSQSIDNKPYIAVDSANRVYVTDPEGFRVLVFDSSGAYLARFGTYGAGPDQFALPVGIAIDAQDNVYVVDAHNNRVVKYPAIFGSPLDEAAPENEEGAAHEPEDQPVEEVEEEGVITSTPVDE